MLLASLRHYTLVIVITLIIVLLSLAATVKLPVQMIPDLDSKTVSVITVWPGANPADVEQEILLEQERYLRSLANLKRLRSEANSGTGVIELEFNANVSMSDALQRVSNALSQVPGYPENVDQPRLETGAFSENPFLFYRLMPLAGNPLNINIDLLRDYADQQIRPALERIDGVASVQLWGAPERQVQVLLDMSQLAQRGISIVQIRDAIRQRNRDVSGGDLDEGQQRFLVRLQGRFDSIDSLGQLIVSQRHGHVTRLSDIATIQLQHAELRQRSFAESERSLTLAVKRQPGSNVIAIKQQMTDRIDQLNQQLASQGLELNLFGDDVRYVEAAIDNAWNNLALGAILASFVLYLYLRSASMTLLGLLSIPLATLTAFAALLLFNRSINVISLAGIAFAIGMTLDNAIVVLESIKEQLRRGGDKLQAVQQGVRQVWTAVLASTLSTVMVLIPVLLIEQEAGQLYSDIAIAIMAAILASMAVALLVLPGALYRLPAQDLQGETLAPHPLLNAQLQQLGQLSRTKQLALTMALFVGLLAGSYALFPPTEYLPGGEEPKAFTRMSAPPGSSLTAMQAVANEVQQELLKHVRVDAGAFERGETAIPPLQYFSLNVDANGLSVLSEPVAPEHLTAMMRGLTAWFETFPGMRAFSNRGSIISSNDGGSRAVVLDLSGTDQLQLFQTAQHLYDAAAELIPLADLTTEPANLTLQQPVWQLRPNWTRLSESGLSVSDFAYSVSALSDGAYVDEMLLDGRQVDVMLLSEQGHTQQMSSLRQQPLVLPNGEILPVSALTTITQGVDNATIRRIDGARTVSVYIIPPRELALEQAVSLVNETLLPQLQQQGKIPSSVQINISGAADQMEKTWQDLLLYFALACAICYLVLVAIFNHWGYALLIMLLVPTAMAGGVFGLALFNQVADVWQWWQGYSIHQALDMMTMLGFLILLGVVVNNPILIVERFRELRLVHEAVDAARLAVLSRQRPIMMTTLTTLMGLSPLVFMPGAGSEIYRGIGIVVLSGLALSTLLSLYVLPLVLMLLSSIAEQPNALNSQSQPRADR